MSDTMIIQGSNLERHIEQGELVQRHPHFYMLYLENGTKRIRPCYSHS